MYVTAFADLLEKRRDFSADQEVFLDQLREEVASTNVAPTVLTTLLTPT